MQARGSIFFTGLIHIPRSSSIFFRAFPAPRDRALVPAGCHRSSRTPRRAGARRGVQKAQRQSDQRVRPRSGEETPKRRPLGLWCANRGAGPPPVGGPEDVIESFRRKRPTTGGAGRRCECAARLLHTPRAFPAPAPAGRPRAANAPPLPPRPHPHRSPASARGSGARRRLPLAAAARPASRLVDQLCARGLAALRSRCTAAAPPAGGRGPRPRRGPEEAKS